MTDQKHPGGRPTKLTPEFQEKFLDAISHHVPYEMAAVANGVGERRIWDWLLWHTHTWF